MLDKYLFIYDGECPFCNYFAQLLELKSRLPSLEILDGRKNLALLSQLYKQGFDLNKIYPNYSAEFPRVQNI